MANRASIAAVRQFNRFYTRQIGVLRKTYLDSPYSLGEMRVLYELAHGERFTASDIARALDLDAGYLSRLLRNFEKRGLISRKTSTKDGRQSHLALTIRGRKLFAPMEERSQHDAGAMLDNLKPSQQSQIVAAMTSIETLLTDGQTVNIRRQAPLYAARSARRRLRLDHFTPCRTLFAGVRLGRTVRRTLRADRRRFRQQLRRKARAMLDRGVERRKCRLRDVGEG